MRLDAKRILVPVNGTPYSERTFRWACQMAREVKAELHAVYVIEVPLALSLEAEIAEDINKGEEILARIEAIGAEEKYKGLQARFLRARQAGPAVVLEAEDRYMDLLIVGVPYKRSFGSCILGATASYIFHNSSSQVMFWREEAPAPTFLRD
jgi:nucleotide-binding universal stress UspA family protein